MSQRSQVSQSTGSKQKGEVFLKEMLDMEIPTERSLRAVPPTYSPSILFTHGNRYRDQTFCTMSDGCYHVRSIPDMRRMRCVASCYGWLILQSYCSNLCYLFNPTSLEKILLPPLIQKIDLGLLTYPPSDSNCVVLLASSNKNSFIICRIGDNKWTKHDLVFKKGKGKFKPVPRHAISCKGKIYLFFFERVMVVIDVHDTFLSSKLHDVEEAELSLPFVGCFESYIVESCGDIFQVVGIHIGVTTNIQTFDVFKLDLSTLDWVKMESLGDRIFLLGESCISLSAAELGVEGNCIYFTCHGSTRLYRFDMGDGTITITLPCPRKFRYWDGPFWVVPNCRLKEKKEVEKVDKSKNEVIKESWENLPDELLELILSSLCLGDCIRFRLTCKSWMSITPPMRSNPPLTRCQHLPWLISFPKNKNAECIFNHPVYGDAYTVNIPELAGAVIHDARHGWLLMSQGSTSILFFNPLTLETIKLPDFVMSIEGISFSAPPTSADCIVFGHDKTVGNIVTVFVYHTGKDDWWEYRIANEVPYEFITANCNPVFKDGNFYCLGKDGKLACFHSEEEDVYEWRILPVPALISWSPSALYSFLMSSEWKFIMEYNGEILSVFVGVEGQHVRVYKLDQSKMRWVVVS